VSAVTHNGVHYSFSLTVAGNQACTTQTSSWIGPKRKPFRQTSHFCGSSGQAAPPMLIQVAQPNASLILDRPTTCAGVRVGRPGGRLSPADTRCSATVPHLRLTVLPPGRAIVVVGIPGVRTVALARLPCTFLCTRQLTNQK